MKVIDERKWKRQGVEVGDVVHDDKGKHYLIVEDADDKEGFPIKVLRLSDATIVDAYRDIKYADLAYTLEVKANKVEVHLRP